MPVPWPNRLFNLCLEYYYTIEFAVLRNPHPNLTLCYENRRPQTAFGEKEGAFSCWREGVGFGVGVLKAAGQWSLREFVQE